MTALPRHTLAGLTLQEATIAAQAIGQHRVDDRCTCVCNVAVCDVCDQCMVFFMDGPIDAYEKAIAEETAKFWAEHARET